MYIYTTISFDSGLLCVYHCVALHFLCHCVAAFSLYNA